jgi:DNA-directed RNA polymerase subunit RPC12/RpoP
MSMKLKPIAVRQLECPHCGAQNQFNIYKSTIKNDRPARCPACRREFSSKEEIKKVWAALKFVPADESADAKRERQRSMLELTDAVLLLTKSERKGGDGGCAALSKRSLAISIRHQRAPRPPPRARVLAAN